MLTNVPNTNAKRTAIRAIAHELLSAPSIDGADYTTLESTIQAHVVDHMDDDDDAYRRLLYWCVGCIHRDVTPDAIRSRMERGHTMWNDPMYDATKKVMSEQDAFIETPFEVEEGVLTCSKRGVDGVPCGNRRIYYYQKQTRSCDEPMTTFATCVKCQHRWVYSG
jgi:DNA-directed RNA polymerase subunit M/transcription elongation factor TFIIS